MQEFLLGVVLPAGVAAAALGLALSIRRSSDGASQRRWAGAIALPGAYLAGHVFIAGWPSWPAIEASEWLVYFAAAAMVVGVVDSAPSTRWWIRWPLRVALSLAVVWLLSGSMREYRWDSRESAVWLLGLTAAMVLVWATVAVGAARNWGLAVAVQLVVIVGATSIVLGLSASAKLAQLCGVLAASVAAMAPFLLRSRRGSPLSGAVPAIVFLWTGLLMIGYFYAEVPATSAVLLAAAPLAVWAAMIPATQRLAHWMPATIAIGLAALIAGAAVAYAYSAAPSAAPQPDDYGEYYDYDY